MTKKDYILIAGAIKKANDNAKGNLSEECAVESTSCDIADVLEKDNTRFDRKKFLVACGMCSW